MATAPPGPQTEVDVDGYGPQGRSEWLDVEWREHLRWVRIGGRNVNVVELGEGPPLVFVHGHSGCWQNWLEQLPHFARSHRCVAPDLPGFGQSEMPEERISIESYARFLDELLEELGIESAPVVGNSMGGFVGAEMCLKHPERVERLVLVAAAGLSTKYVGLSKDLFQRRAVAAFARAVNAYAAVPDARAETLVRRPRLRRAVLRMVVKHPERLPPPLARELIRGSGMPAAPYATDAIMTYDFRDHLSDVGCPTLIVWGADDEVVPEGADDYERLIPNSRKIVLPDTGHVPQIERPVAFNALLEEFLGE
jgi:pimeloyl-ACP methyl ester carboxylesterase